MAKDMSFRCATQEEDLEVEVPCSSCGCIIWAGKHEKDPCHGTQKDCLEALKAERNQMAMGIVKANIEIANLKALNHRIDQQLGAKFMAEDDIGMRIYGYEKEIEAMKEQNGLMATENSLLTEKLKTMRLEWDKAMAALGKIDLMLEEVEL